MNDAHSPQPMISLVGQTSELNGQVFSAGGNNLVIGRQQGCQLQINHSQISRQHARLVAAPGQWLVEDLGSANGTFVNGRRVSGNQPIRSGDRLGLGTYEFIFMLGAADDRTMPASAVPPPQPAYAPPQPPAQAPPRQAYPPPPQPAYPPPQANYPPQQQQPMPPPQANYSPQPAAQVPPQQAFALPPGQVAAQPRRSSCLRTCLITTAILFVLIVLPLAALGYFFRDEITAQINNLLNQGDVSGSVSGRESVTVTSEEGGLVTSESGASVLIPPGAVPHQENGDPGEMTFSMHEQEDREVTLPQGFDAVGAVYQLGPEGFTFNTPVILSLPIPDGVEPARVMGLTYFDANAGEWVMVPAAVDTENRMVSVSTTHFSPWAVFGFFDDDDLNWRNEHGGVVRVVNEHRYDSGIYPPEGGVKPYTVTYGVCIRSYNLDDPNQRWTWPPPADWTMTVNDYVHPLADAHWRRRAHDWWLPNGDYELIEVWHFSEVNHAPLYSPQFASFWQPIGTVRVDRDNHQEYVYAEGGFSGANVTQGRPPCFGVADTSVGHGDVQITLTWEASVDLDLHVVDPSGEEIYYDNTSSASGGQLDRDNLCSNLVIGRPENVFWPTGGAPDGTYKVFVNYYGGCESNEAVSYTLRTVVRGQVTTYDGTISPDNSPQEVTTFSLP
jgi:hypothetical protein